MLGNIFSDKEANSHPELPISFVLAPQKQLRVSSPQDNTVKTWRYYSHHIARFPLDLRAHAQRLFWGVDHDASNLLVGALQDLFIALDESGNALKQKLLDITKPKLESRDVAYFEKWLASGERSDYSHRLGSVLDNGLPGQPQKLVTPAQSSEDSVASYDNTIDEARACLEYGQVEEAQKILEDELQRDSRNDEVAQELLNIYQYTRDAAALEASTQQLLKDGVTLSETWKQTQTEAQDW